MSSLSEYATSEGAKYWKYTGTKSKRAKNYKGYHLYIGAKTVLPRDTK